MRRPDEGMALLYVLWLVAILSVVAFEMRYASHLRMQVTANIGIETKAYYCARAGVERTIADLLVEKDDQEAGLDSKVKISDEEDESRYLDVKVGDGTYTLYAGVDEFGQQQYGPIDACSRINLNTADATVLAEIPGIGEALAADIAATRQKEALNDLNELLRLPDVTLTMLYGEDQNHNGLLDPNEDDGDASWPPDNADGELDGGIAAYLTLWSATREVSKTGTARVKLNEASADAITKAIPSIDKQHADSIVVNRDKKKFTSIADLLDVDLMEQKAGGGGGSNGPPPIPEWKSTGQKAFDKATFRKIADLVTVADGETSSGLVNINTASSKVLACLPGIDEGLAQKIVDARQGKRDHFETVADLMDVGGLSDDVFKGVCRWITTRSDVFELRSFGTVESQRLYRCVDAVVDRSENRVQVRSWKVLE